MTDIRLYFVIRTPRTVIFEQDVDSLRVPTETGQVGLRPRSEPSILAVEPGLIVVRCNRHTYFAGTAGGLLHGDGRSASLLTPVAVVGDELASVLSELERTLARPSAEQEVRKTLMRLEQNILQELDDDGSEHPTLKGHHP